MLIYGMTNENKNWMKWILTYTKPDDKLELKEELDIPHADTFKKVRRWWRKSEYKLNKLIKGTKI